MCTYSYVRNSNCHLFDMYYIYISNKWQLRGSHMTTLVLSGAHSTEAALRSISTAENSDVLNRNSLPLTIYGSWRIHTTVTYVASVAVVTLLCAK